MALTYFRIVNYSLPLLLLGMTSGAGLRASGAPGAQHALNPLEWGCQRPPRPFVHIWFMGDPGMGLDGAALATVCSRIALCSPPAMGRS